MSKDADTPETVENDEKVGKFFSRRLMFTETFYAPKETVENETDKPYYKGVWFELGTRSQDGTVVITLAKLFWIGTLAQEITAEEFQDAFNKANKKIRRALKAK